MNLLVSGSTAYDRIMDFPGKFSDHILPHKVHNINVSFGLDNLTVQFGGSGSNIAYSLALLGQRPYLISQVGTDWQRYRQWLLHHQVRLDCVRRVTNDTCSTAHIITDLKDNQITAFHFGAMRYAATAERSIRHRVERLVKSETTMALLAAGNLDDMLTLAQLYQRQHVRYIVDPGQQTVWLTPAQLRILLRGASALIVNDYELAMVEKKLRTTTARLRRQLPYLIVTLGEKGAVWYVLGKRHTLPVAKPKQVVDPTGAGDAYRAGVILGLAQQWDVSLAGRVAALCATYAIEQYGTQQHTFTAEQFVQRHNHLFGRHYRLTNTELRIKIKSIPNSLFLIPFKYEIRR